MCWSRIVAWGPEIGIFISIPNINKLSPTGSWRANRLYLADRLNNEQRPLHTTRGLGSEALGR
jgi:hypothetical protein